MTNKQLLEKYMRENRQLHAIITDLSECLTDTVDELMIDFPDNDKRKKRYKKALSKATLKP